MWGHVAQSHEKKRLLCDVGRSEAFVLLPFVVADELEGLQCRYHIVGTNICVCSDVLNRQLFVLLEKLDDDLRLWYEASRRGPKIHPPHVRTSVIKPKCVVNATALGSPWARIRYD